MTLETRTAVLTEKSVDTALAVEKKIKEGRWPVCEER